MRLCRGGLGFCSGEQFPCLGVSGLAGGKVSIEIFEFSAVIGKLLTCGSVVFLELVSGGVVLLNLLV